MKYLAVKYCTVYFICLSFFLGQKKPLKENFNVIRAIWMLPLMLRDSGAKSNGERGYGQRVEEAAVLKEFRHLSLW